jgi:hypothetical protein
MMYPLEILNIIIENNLVLLVVEPNLLRKKDGIKYFEQREPGCIKAYCVGFAYLLRNLEKQLDIELITTMHKHVMQFEGRRSAIIPGEFRQGSMAFTIPPQKATVQGLKQLYTNQKKNNQKQYSIVYKENRGSYEYPHINAKKYTYKRLAPTKPSIGDSVNEIVNSYNVAVNHFTDTTDIREKVKVIAKHIQQFELLHPFNDGNGRVFVNGLLNWMLIKNGFPIAIFEEPNIFDAYSVEELTDAIIEACYATCCLALNPNAHIYGINTESDIEYKEDPTRKETIREALSERQVPSFSDRKIIDIQHRLLRASKVDNEIGCLRQIVFDPRYQITKDMKLTHLVSAEGLSPFYRGRNALHIALLSGNKRIANDILEKYPELIKVPDMWGLLPVVHAIPTRDIELIKRLLLPIDELGQIDNAAFMAAEIVVMAADCLTDADYRQLTEIVQYERKLTTALWADLIKQAIDDRKEEVALRLLDRLANISKEGFQQLCNHDFLPTTNELGDAKIIHHAALRGCVKLLEKLYKLDKTVILQVNGKFHYTCAHFAISLQQERALEWLLTTAPELTEKADRYGVTPLLYAELQKATQCEKILQQHGAKLATPEVRAEMAKRAIRMQLFSNNSASQHNNRTIIDTPLHQDGCRIF